MEKRLFGEYTGVPKNAKHDALSLEFEVPIEMVLVNMIFIYGRSNLNTLLLVCRNNSLMRVSEGFLI
jgi:hypothetical protein